MGQPNVVPSLSESNGHALYGIPAKKEGQANCRRYRYLILYTLKYSLQENYNFHIENTEISAAGIGMQLGRQDLWHKINPAYFIL